MRHPGDPLANRLYLCGKDMREARGYLTSYRAAAHVPTPGPHDLLAAVLLAVIITYSRCFLNSRSGGKAARFLGVDELELFDGFPELEQMHDAMIHARDKAAAHSDWERHQTQITVDEKTGKAKRSATIPLFYLGLDTTLIEPLINHVESRVTDLWRELDKAYLKQIGSAEASMRHNRG